MLTVRQRRWRFTTGEAHPWTPSSNWLPQHPWAVSSGCCKCLIWWCYLCHYLSFYLETSPEGTLCLGFSWLGTPAGCHNKAFPSWFCWVCRLLIWWYDLSVVICSFSWLTLKMMFPLGPSLLIKAPADCLGLQGLSSGFLTDDISVWPDALLAFFPCFFVHLSWLVIYLVNTLIYNPKYGYYRSFSELYKTSFFPNWSLPFDVLKIPLYGLFVKRVKTKSGKKNQCLILS